MAKNLRYRPVLQISSPDRGLQPCNQPDIFGGPELTFGPKKRLGSDLSRLSQLQDTRWKVVSDYVKP